MEIKVLHQVMDWNEDVSEEVKETLSSHHICMINVMGSPGAGKTSLITSLIGTLRKDWRAGVIEGDIAGQIDAERIADLGIPSVQLNTDGACHIEAMSIQHILPELPLQSRRTCNAPVSNKIHDTSLFVYGDYTLRAWKSQYEESVDK